MNLPARGHTPGNWGASKFKFPYKEMDTKSEDERG